MEAYVNACAVETSAPDNSLVLYDVRDGVGQTSNDQLFAKFVDPPVTTEPREVELHQSDGSTFVRSLPAKLRSLPTEILYDSNGLTIFDEITDLEEYYLTACEKDILMNQMASIISHIPDGASVIELGCGSMAKTAIILDHLRVTGKQGISFYALDIEEGFLKMSLSALMQDELKKEVATENAIKYAGIIGSYDQALTSILREIKGPRVILWLGSSIGNYTREEAEDLVGRFQTVLDVGDLFLIGIDKRNDPVKVARAYNDDQGVSAKFGLNGLNHINELVGSVTFPLEKFAYCAGYNASEGRHEAYYRSLADQTITIPIVHKGADLHKVALKKDELIRYEFSYKYSMEEVHHLGTSAGLSLRDQWTDSKEMYRLCLFQKGVSQSLGVAQMPTIQDWEEVWSQWDCVTSPSMIKDFTAKPIDLRHPFIFYVGHIPTFCDILLCRGLKEKLLPPEYYKDIFERGMDPDVEDPSVCHPHSEVPDKWPELDEILEYKQRVRQRVRQIYQSMDAGALSVPLRRVGRVLHMAMEHEIMHTETLLYMLVQSHQITPPVEKPSLDEIPAGIAAPRWLMVKGGEVAIGLEDSEASDLVEPQLPASFGWDNESPMRYMNLPSFEIQHRPVTNLEYLLFMKLLPAVPEELIPSSFAKCEESEMYGVKTIFGVIPVMQARNWPVSLNYHQATAYMKHLQALHKDDSIHIPSESELVQFYNAHRFMTSKPNAGFQNWFPVSLSNEEVHVFGSLWEWTSTELEMHPGYVESELYPGYSSDFFDSKHNVVKGGSWATHRRLVGRLRNFYQRSYPFAFIGVRFARCSSN